MMRAGLLFAAAIPALACGPRAHIPPVPRVVANAADSATASLAIALAPMLHLQRDEYFELSRVVAVVHPTRPVIAYHLLWRDDVNGAWIPFTKATDEEVVWVAYDSTTHRPARVWAYWHNRLLESALPDTGRPHFNVQWGKHGSLPTALPESSLPRWRTLNAFYAVEFLLLPDIWLGNLNRRGPWGFFHSYKRYREFSRPLDVGPRIDVIVQAEDADETLGAVFGRPYSRKRPWPWR